MKYFTKEFCLGNLTDEEFDKRLKEYKNHMSIIERKLPNNLKSFYYNINLHDGRITSIKYSYKKHDLELNCRIGDNNSGYSELNINYTLSNESKDYSKILNNLKKQKNNFEMLYDELDIKSNFYTHSIIFWPIMEIEIEFININYKIICINN